MNLRKIASKVASQPFESFGLVSAFIKGAGKDENEARHKALMKDLAELGLRHSEFHGVWEGSRELSIVVKDIAPDVLELLGRKYGQEAVVYVAPGCRKLIRLKGL